jgi:hypothetical protein
VTQHAKEALTPDLGGPGTTAGLTAALVEAVRAQPAAV